MLITVSNLNKFYGDTQILKDINFVVDNRHHIGIVGRNGAGKSTLMKILTGSERYDSGNITVASGVTIGFLEQNSSIDSDDTIFNEMLTAFPKLIQCEKKLKEIGEKLTILDINLAEYKENAREYASLQAFFESNGGYTIDVDIKTILNGMGFQGKPLETSVRTLSGGEKTRLCMAKLLLMNPDVLLLDEPTNHLDFDTLKWLEEYLNTKFKGAIIAISHDRYFLDKTANYIWELSMRRLTAYRGNYTKYKQLKEDKYIHDVKEYEAQQLEIIELKDYIARNMARASTTKMAQSRQAKLERMEILEKPVMEKRNVYFDFDIYNTSYNEVLTIKDMKLWVGQGETAKTLIENGEMSILRGQKVALVGSNGAGKSSLFKTLIKQLTTYTGTMEWGRNTTIGYFEQEHEKLNHNKTVLNELWDRYRQKSQQDIRNILGRVGFSGELIYNLVGTLSGGEYSRLTFGILMLEKANVLLLDEPTNHLDLDTREALEEALLRYEGTLFFISHDRYFINRLAEKIIEIENQEFVQYNLSFDLYIQEKSLEQTEILQRQSAEKVIHAQDNKDKTSTYRSKQQRANDERRKAALRELEKNIAFLESEIARKEELITQSEVYKDYELLNDICHQIDRHRSDLDKAMEEWLELQ